MCTDLGISRGNISDLKMGRIESLSADKLAKIATYFKVSVDYLLTGEETKKAPTDGERIVSDDDIMFALWGDSDDVDEDDLDDVKRYAAFVRERKKKK
jgi:transcriptional regulator with XRE-family HTH domain